MRQRDKPADPDAAEIAKLLDSITSAGHRPDEIFNDWLEMVAAALERAITPFRSAGYEWRLIQSGMEDVFIHLMESSKDNYPS